MFYRFDNLIQQRQVPVKVVKEVPKEIIEEVVREVPVQLVREVQVSAPYSYSAVTFKRNRLRFRGTSGPMISSDNGVHSDFQRDGDFVMYDNNRNALWAHNQY